MSDRVLWIWLSLACGPGSRVYNKLFASFSTLREIYDAPPERYRAVDGVQESVVRALSDKRTERAEEILALCRKNGWSVITYGDKIYPGRLKTLIDPPVVLYCRGRLIDLNDNVCIAVVGTRRMTEYGESLAYRLSHAMAAGGAVIVSGMALGCDAMAANGALDASAPTVAVLGCGIDIVYPRQHATLASHIARSGMILTEYPPGSPPEAKHFPVRNRIISGLSQGTLVVEAPVTSGALITASTAVAQGRDIFAVPGEVGRENSSGCNDLIKNGARAVTSAADILSVYEFTYPHRINVEAAMREERRYREGEGRDSAAKRRIASRPQIKETSSEAEENFRRKLEEADAEGSFSFEKDRREREAAIAANAARQRTRDKTGRADRADRTDRSESAADSVPEALSGTERDIYIAIGDGAVTPDELAANGFSASEVMTALTMLELLGHVRALPGGRYAHTEKAAAKT